MTTFVSFSVDLSLKRQDVLRCHISTGSFFLIFSPDSVVASITTGIGNFCRLSMVITAPFLGSNPSYSTERTAWSNAQLFINQPRQNHARFSPVSFSIVRKKSSGVGCLYAQYSIYLRKALSKRSAPITSSRNSRMPYAGL